MRGVICICCVAVLVGCAGDTEETDTAAGDTTGMAPPAAVPAPGTVALADFAGTWTVRAMRENSDSVIVTYTLTADADSTWSIKFDDRPDPVPVQVLHVGGDSVVTHAGPYSSAVYPGRQVTTHGAFRLEGGRLVGRTEARYTGTGVGADSLVIIRNEGTRN